MQVWGVGVWTLAAFHTVLSVGHTNPRGSSTSPGYGKVHTLWIGTVSKGGHRLLCASKSVSLLTTCLMEFGVTFDSVSFV